MTASRLKISRLVCAAFFLLCAFSVPADAQEPGRSVELVAEIEAQDYGVLEIRTYSTFRAPADDPLVADAFTGDPESLALIGRGFGLFKEGRRDADGEPVELRTVEDGFAEATETGLGYPDATTTLAGPFKATLEGQATLASPAVAEQAAALNFVVIADDGVDLTALEPVPSQLTEVDGQQRAEWNFSAGQAERISVEADVPWSAEAFASISESNWGSLRGPIAVFVLCLFTLIAVVVLRPLPESRRASERQRMLFRSLHALALAASVAVAGLLIGALAQVVTPPPATGFDLESAWSIFLEAGPPLLIIAAAMFVAWGSDDRMRAVVLVIGLLAATGALVAAIDNVWVGDGTSFGAPATWKAIVAVAIVGAVCLLFVFGFARHIAEAIDPDPVSPSPLLVGAGLVGLATVGILVYVYEREPVGFVDAGSIQGFFDIRNSLGVFAPMFAIAAGFVAYGLVRSWQSEADEERFLVRGSELWTLLVLAFLFLVVGTGGSILGFRAPFALAFAALFLWPFLVLAPRRLDQVDADFKKLNDKSLFALRPKLLARAVFTEWLQRARASESIPGTTSPDEFEAYRKKLNSFKEQEEALGAESPPSEDKLRELAGPVKLPSDARLRYMTLGLGPRNDWLGNGRLAIKLGLPLIAIPLIYFFALLGTQLDDRLDPSYGFELVEVLVASANEVTFWLVAIFAFGCLYSSLPFGTGVLKGLLLAASVAVGLGLARLVPTNLGGDDWIFRSIELFLVLAALGVRMDLATMRTEGYAWRSLAELYELRSVQFGVTSLVPVVLAILALAQQLQSGDARSAVDSFIDSAGKVAGLGG